MVSNLPRMTKVGISKEANFGTAVLPPEFLIPVTSVDVQDNYQTVVDQGFRGIPAMDFVSRRTFGTGESNLEGWFYADSFGLLLLNMMGTVASTAAVGGTSPAIHVFTLSKAPPSITIFDERDALTSEVFPGQLNSNLTIRFTRNEGALNWSSNYTGHVGTDATDETFTDNATDPFMAWQATVSAGGAADEDVLSMEMSLERSVSLVHSSNNSQSISTGYVGPLQVSGRMMVNYNVDAKLDRFTGNTQETVQVIFTNGSGSDAERSFTAQIGTIEYGASPAVISRDGDFMTLEYNFRGLYNSSDGGPIKFWLKNATDTY